MNKTFANSDELIVDAGNVAHLPKRNIDCGQRGNVVTVAQCLVWLKPAKCGKCFPLGTGAFPW